MTRRHFFGRASTGIGVAALAQLLGVRALSADAADTGGLAGLPHFAPKAKRVIYLYQSGGPSQLELFDYKPQLARWTGDDLPDSIRKGQRLTAMTATQAKFPVLQSGFKFAQHGKTGTWVSELLPHTAKIVDDICLIKSTNTEQINHDPAVTFAQTGFQLAGRPSLGAWVSYGLGSENKDLPGFIVMVSQNRSGLGGQPLSDRFWGTGFLPTRYQGVKLRGGGDPVLYLSDPAGFEQAQRKRFIDDLEKLNQIRAEEFHDPEINTRISQYEMAFQMQTSVPELTDLSKEPARTFELYGEDAHRRGSFASNCLMARRLAERGVRFIQLYHRGWDQHRDLPRDIALQCRGTDQPTAALITDLKQRGLLDDTLVIWGGEFGRTVFSQGKLTDVNYGRDHHPRNFCMWAAGGGIKRGFVLGETDDFSYNVVSDPVSVYDLQATILHLLGIDHTKLTYRFQGRDFRLTDVHGEIVRKILA
jgi:hypothetical protein